MAQRKILVPPFQRIPINAVLLETFHSFRLGGNIESLPTCLDLILPQRPTFTLME